MKLGLLGFGLRAGWRVCLRAIADMCREIGTTLDGACFNVRDRPQKSQKRAQPSRKGLSKNICPCMVAITFAANCLSAIVTKAKPRFFPVT